MGKPQPLWQPSASVTLDGNGNGQAAIGPQRPREHWQVTSANVSVGTNVKESVCTAYMGVAPTPASFMSSTVTGSTGDACGINQDMQTGMQIFAVWQGGDPGAIATVVVNGTYSIGEPT